MGQHERSNLYQVVRSVLYQAASYVNEMLPKLICQLDCTLPETKQITAQHSLGDSLEGGCTASLQFATGSDSKTPGLYAGQNQRF